MVRPGPSGACHEEAADGRLVGAVSKAGGFPPEYQPDRYGDRWAPVLVTWDSSATNPLLAGDVLGRAGPQSFTGTAADSTRWVTAQAIFNAPALDAQMRLGHDEDAKAVLLHELAHVAELGLGRCYDDY